MLAHMANKSQTLAAAPTPHSWDLEHWPAHVYPHDTRRARYLVRVHRDELLIAGALTRVGRELVFLGARYTRWLESRTVNVANFDNGCARTRATAA